MSHTVAEQCAWMTQTFDLTFIGTTYEITLTTTIPTTTTFLKPRWNWISSSNVRASLLIIHVKSTGFASMPQHVLELDLLNGDFYGNRNTGRVQPIHLPNYNCELTMLLQLPRPPKQYGAKRNSGMQCDQQSTNATYEHPNTQPGRCWVTCCHGMSKDKCTVTMTTVNLHD